MENTGKVLHHTFWIGVTPMITDEMIAYIISVFDLFFKKE